jgi:hypothetical protein
VSRPAAATFVTSFDSPSRGAAPTERLEAARRRYKHGPVHDRKATVTVVSDQPTSESAP